MRRTFYFCFIMLVAGFMTTGCAVSPGQFAGGNYQQITLNPHKKVKEVTFLRLTSESQKEMIQKQGTVVIGKSIFTIDSDDLDSDTLETEAKAQAKAVKANVVLFSQCYEGLKTKTKIETQKSEFQQAADDIPLALGASDSETKSNSSTNTTYNSDESSDSTTQKGSSSFAFDGAATLGELTALIPGNIVHKKVNYEVKEYEIHAIFIRTPAYPGLD
ncbi:hypothetical protein JWG39_14485 [Desulforhopalus vacuolatus]|uniref:hypothetical protein n=1 Tax=Desulforhopalus vacuolatus TaxID=40414 RepID=UPI00196621D6|nr:hypothetical protein [Desulforhopalus vacuolatus]MBM9521025.1 hypothetical protein [Desulforhopalus vacuolatus]